MITSIINPMISLLKYSTNFSFWGLTSLPLGLFSIVLLSDGVLASPNWCTKSLDEVVIDNQWVNLAPACRGHDICYFTSNPNSDPRTLKSNCDAVFHNELKQICNDLFEAQTSEPFRPSSREKCYRNAQTYYNAVSGSGGIGLITSELAQKSFNDAQAEAREVKQRLEARLPGIDISQYHADIAWELANRQANGESVSESKANAIESLINRRILPFFGAIAYSPNTKKIGWSFSYRSKEDAESAASKACGATDCKSLWFLNAVGVLAQAKDGWAINWGYTQDQAEQNALKGCRQVAKSPETCRVLYVVDSAKGTLPSLGVPRGR